MLDAPTDNTNFLIVTAIIAAIPPTLLALATFIKQIQTSGEVRAVSATVETNAQAGKERGEASMVKVAELHENVAILQKQTDGMQTALTTAVTGQAHAEGMLAGKAEERAQAPPQAPIVIQTSNGQSTPASVKDADDVIAEVIASDKDKA